MFTTDYLKTGNYRSSFRLIGFLVLTHLVLMLIANIASLLQKPKSTLPSSSENKVFFLKAQPVKVLTILIFRNLHINSRQVRELNAPFAGRREEIQPALPAGIFFAGIAFYNGFRQSKNAHYVEKVFNLPVLCHY